MISIHNQAQLDTLKQEKATLLILFGGANCGVCQTIKPQIQAKFSEQFPDLAMAYIDFEQQQAVCAQHSVFSLPVIQVFFKGQKFIEVVRGISLPALAQKIEQTLVKMND